MLDFVKGMVNGFDVGPTGAHIGVVTFSSKPHLEFHLNKYTDKAKTIQGISNIQYISGGTNTADALKYARLTSFLTANGARGAASKIAIVITDGKSQSPPATAAEAQRLRDQGITVFSVGVGSGPNLPELNSMATDPNNQHVFVVTNFDALKQIKGTLAQKACEGIYTHHLYGSFIRIDAKIMCIQCLNIVHSVLHNNNNKSKHVQLIIIKVSKY